MPPTTLFNWSGTHDCTPASFAEPTCTDELVRCLRAAHQQRTRVRPVGKALSPNGIGMSAGGVVRLTRMAEVIKVDPQNSLVTLQAGASVRQVLEELAKHDLTLQNLASIAEQTVAGWAQAGCHGNGARLPPIEEQIVAMRLVTPAQGELLLSDASNPHLFGYAKCGLGLLGVVSELTLKCVPAHRLVERVCTMPRAEVGRWHGQRIAEHRHAKYLWIPYTDTTVVFTADPPTSNSSNDGNTGRAITATHVDEQAALAPARKFLAEVAPALPARIRDAMSFTKLRSRLLAVAPLDREHVAKVNHIEAQYWTAVAGTTEAASEDILQFDCGGQQLVFEIAFQTGTFDNNDGQDLTFINALLAAIHRAGIPAPAPIEQRWTARSSARMSPAYSEDPSALFCWVGVIMYLPGGIPEEQRQQISRSFEGYSRLVAQVAEPYRAFPHWAKLELGVLGASGWRELIRRRFPHAPEFIEWRRRLDPHGVLSNAMMDQLFPVQARL